MFPSKALHTFKSAVLGLEKAPIYKDIQGIGIGGEVGGGGDGGQEEG